MPEFKYTPYKTAHKLLVLNCILAGSKIIYRKKCVSIWINTVFAYASTDVIMYVFMYYIFYLTV